MSFRPIHFASECCISETAFPVESAILVASFRSLRRSLIFDASAKPKRIKLGRITMNKFLLGAVGLVAMANTATAADLAARPYTKAPPPMIAALYDWSGFYIGANGGWGSSRKEWDNVTPGGLFLSEEGSHDATGAVAGGQIGYRWQSSAWVFGLEGQGYWADLRGSN